MSGERKNTDKELYLCLVCNEEFSDLDTYVSHKEGSEKDFFACKKWNSAFNVEEDINNLNENCNSPQLVENEDLNNHLENHSSSQFVEKRDLNALLENYNSPQSVANGDLNTLLENYNSPPLVEEEDLNTLIKSYITPYSNTTPVKFDKALMVNKIYRYPGPCLIHVPN